MDLRSLLEALAAALIAVVMFLSGRSCQNAEYQQGVPVYNEAYPSEGGIEGPDSPTDPAGNPEAPEGAD